MSEIERARTAIRNLRQMGCVTRYIQKFRDLRFQIPDMGNPEAYSHFIAGLNPDIRMQIGVHVQRNDLEAAIAMAKERDCYQRVEAGKMGQKSKQEVKISTKTPATKAVPQLNMVQGGASSSGVNEPSKKGGKKGKGFRKPKNRKCMACQEEGHWIQNCPYMAKLLKTVREDKKSSKN